MSDSSSELLASRTADARAWAQRAQQTGWLTDAEASSLNSLSGETSSDLFADDAGEPLVVALFGGTGVGKSSLLNRLVGESIARVGVIRPTSLEATVYVHRSVEFAGPTRAGFQRATHENDARRQVVWVDMPDVDSTAAHNRELVLDFLPFVDVLIYVVSPERYRDESPWALLRAHAERSAWVFVMNQIDRGQQAQLDDLERALDAAGFADPVLYATSCGAETELDQFEELARFIDSLQEERVRETLQEEGRAARLRLLGEQVSSITEDWPTKGNGANKLSWAWQQRKKEMVKELSQDLVERLAPVAARMAKGEAAAPGELWDDWASERVGDALAATRLDAIDAGWSQQSVARLDDVVDDALGSRGETALRESVRASLSQPGNRFQRAIFSATGWLQFALPLVAVAWISWYVLKGFYGGANGSGSFVAEGFAVNAALLVALAAGLPWLLGRLAKPSPRKAALIGIRRGLDDVVEYIDSRTLEQIKTSEAELEELITTRDELQVPDVQTSSELTSRLRRGG